MNKKLVVSTLLASMLTLNMSYAVFAAPASENTVVTGRTEQNRQTGIITPVAIQNTIFHNVTKEITLTGTVVIDGPELVFTVTDPDGNLVASDKITVVKIADKTYTYSAKVDPSKWKGNVSFALNAKTIYKNGKPAGQTHTSAPEQKQIIHVAYVSGFEYNDFTWGAYDRSNNQYPYSYNLVNILSFDTENPVWTYNSDNNKYDLSFTLIKNLSNGQSNQEKVFISGVAPSTAYTYNANDSMSPDYSQDFTFIAPAAPVPVVPVVSDVSVSNINPRWTGYNGNGGNVQERYTLIYKINGQTFSQELSTNFTKGTGFVDQNLIYQASFNGQTVNINYTLNYVEPASLDNNTSNADHGNNNGNGKN